MTYPTVNGVFSNHHAFEWLTQIAILNGRLFVLLAIALLLIRFFKGSAAKRHFMMVLAFVAAIALPFASQWFPAIEIVVEIDQPVSALGSTNNFPDQTRVINTVGTQKPYLLYWVFLYLSISVFFLVQILRSNLSIHRLISNSSNLGLAPWNKTLDECCELLGTKTSIVILHSKSISSPLTWGFSRSYILIPTTALEWNDEMRRSALLHELAHIKRKDCLSKQFARVVCAVYWINPLCWIALKHFSHYAESASDDLALRSGIKLSHYAENLLQVAIQVNQRQKQWTLAAMSMVGFPVDKLSAGKKPSQLSLRVSAILNPDGCRAPINTSCVLLTFLLVFGLLLPITSFKASLVEQYNYIVSDSVPIVPASKQTTATPETYLDKDYGLNELNEKLEAQLDIQKALKQNIKYTALTPPLPKVEYREVPASEVLEKAKQKVQHALASIGKTKDGESALKKQNISAKEDPSANLAAANEEDIDVVSAFDLAGIMGTHEAL